MSEPVTKYRRQGMLLAFAIFVTDQIAKYLVTVPLNLEAARSIEILPLFNLTWAQNYGVSMGFLTADNDLQRWMLVAMTFVIALVVLAWMRREALRGDILALGMILGGAFGNIIDRARLGYVVDYADLHIGEFRPFLIFNIADAAITIGVVILLARALLLREKDDNGADRGA
jgi:signal peptidase II